MQGPHAAQARSAALVLMIPSIESSSHDRLGNAGIGPPPKGRTFLKLPSLDSSNGLDGARAQSGVRVRTPCVMTGRTDRVSRVGNWSVPRVGAQHVT